MNIKITGRDFELTPSLEEFINEKAAKLTKYDSRIEDVDVVLSCNDGHHKKGDIFTAEIRIDTAGKNLLMKETRDDMHAAVDVAIDKVKYQLERQREKMKDEKRGFKGLLKGIIRK